MFRHCLSRFPSVSGISYRRASTVPGSNVPITIRGKPAAELYDGNSELMQTIDIADLPRAQKRFAVQFEKVNEERVKEIFEKNYKNHIGLATLLGVAIGIYYYTIHAVRQETFLEEIDDEVAMERGEAPPSKQTSK